MKVLNVSQIAALAAFLAWLLASQLGAIQAQGARKDLTKEPNALGAAVVRAVVNLIQNSEIFPDDKQLLRRIAFVESTDGNDPNTYRDGYYGGIWQVDRAGFEDTKDVTSHPNLRIKLEEVHMEFGIKWEDVQWRDLLKPLYSGLAARLFLSNKPESIPSDIQGQAEYWKRHYNTEAGAGTVQDFVERVNSLRTQTMSGN